MLDHCLLIRDNLWEVTKVADDLIDLVFNTIAAYQNETVKQLTIATIVFLPLTFLWGILARTLCPFPSWMWGLPCCESYPSCSRYLIYLALGR